MAIHFLEDKVLSLLLSIIQELTKEPDKNTHLLHYLLAYLVNINILLLSSIFFFKLPSILSPCLTWFSFSLFCEIPVITTYTNISLCV